MSDAIPLEQKRPISDEKRQHIIRQRKAAALRQTFYCKTCDHICERWGGQATQTVLQRKTHDPTIPYRFCENCTVDYKDYIAVLQGDKETGCTWQRSVVDCLALLDRLPGSH